MSYSAHIGSAMSILQAVLLVLCFTAVLCDAGERWSRQLTGESSGDWVPLSSGALSKRQATARVLTQPAPFQSSFFPAETYPSDFLPQDTPRQLYLQSIPSGQSGLQGNSLNQPLVQFALSNPQINPLAQAFVPQSLQYNNNYGKNNNYQSTQFQQQTSFPGPFVRNPSQITNQFYNQPGSINSGLAPVLQPQKSFKQQDSSRFVDGYKLENVSVETNNKKKQNSNAHKTKLEKTQQEDTPQRITERSSTIRPQPTTPTITTVEKEEVQLLYVPLETLQSEQFNMKEFLKNSQKQEALRDSIGSPGQINNQLYSPTTPSYLQRQQTQLHNIQQDLIQQAFNTQTLQAKFKQNPFDNRQSKYQQVGSSVLPFGQTVSPFSQTVFPTPVITTPKSKKLKAHQPPLAVYMAFRGQGKAKLSDVLGVLKEAKSVSVLDSFSPNSPKIFIGPSTLRIPDNYAKFDLPYLSSVDGSRIQRKVEQLPFFVAPLSYKAPEGFAKIPFPPPHVGSVIVNPFMRDPFETPRLTQLADPVSNPFAFNNFQHNPSTESFRSTLSETSSPKQNTFNYFPSATPNPVQSSQSTLPAFQSSFLPFEPFRPLQSNRNPDPTVISSSRAPLASYFSTPASKPTVSYFSFPGPEYTTIPTTSKKPSTSFNYDNRGHYITNAAVDATSLKNKTPAKETFTEKLQTTPIPQTTPKFQTHNPFSINQAFTFKSPYEPVSLKTNIRANEVREYNTEIPAQYNNQQGFNTYTQGPQQYSDIRNTQRPHQYLENTQRPQQYSEIQNTQKPQFTEIQNTQRPQQFAEIQNTPRPAEVENIQYTNDYSPRPFFSDPTKTTTIETVTLPVRSQPAFDEDFYKKTEYKDSFASIGNKYSRPSAESYEEEVVYQTENPTTNEITTPISTSTTTTTTTVAPTIKSTRRPIHSRGRPRYTTAKPDNGETTTRQSTTRRTPIRERKPNHFRTKLESSRTSTTEASVDMPSFESGKRIKLDQESRKPPARHPAHRYKTQDEEVKTTTESSSTKTAVTNRNQRLRSRGRIHFKNSDNQDGAELILKKGKKQGEGESLAYQRDVLHQNYPVTFSERMTTVEVHSSTPMPPSSQSIDLSNGKIRIYETTGINQKLSSESPFAADYYENQPIFQGEQEKFITHPELYVQINGKSGSSTPGIDQYSASQESTTERFISSTPKYEKESKEPQAVAQEYFNIENYSQSSIEEKEQVFENKKQEVETTPKPAEEYQPEADVTETPIAKFRSKLRSRPKLLSTLNVQKETENAETLASPPKKIEDTTESSYVFTRRSSLQPVTYRPAFDRRRTTMRIEEIEAELKSSRHQMRFDSSQSTTKKYPVYIPESSSTSSNSDVNEENDVTSTTKRNNFVRRRPVRPTAAPVSATSPRSRTTTESTPVSSNAPKRVRVRGRIRTRPTTTEKADVTNGSQEEASPVELQGVTDEKYTATQRSSLHKYTTRGRQATQKYFRRPSTATERNSQSSTEDVEDQASYDSINRPEYVEYKPEGIKEENEDYNPDNGKSESQWSPKLTYSSFKPIFNPNLIADEIKPEGIEYGTKLPSSEMNTEKTDIITAGLPYDDVLISVTPSTNNLNNEPSSFLNTELPPTPEIDVNNRDGKSEDDIISSDTASTFESVLEEVMRNLEQQDENEYADYNKPVMKHEGGEIGEIPPEAVAVSTFAKESSNPGRHLTRFNTDIKKVVSRPSKPVPEAERFDFTKAEERSFQKFPEVRFQTTSTERQPRRRGVWKKIRVRPAHKDILETAESQFYRNSGNDLINKEEKQSLSFNKQVEPEEKTQVQQTLEQPSTTLTEMKVEESVQPTIPTTSIPEEDVVTERIQSPGDMDLGTGAPDILGLAMDAFNFETTMQSNEVETPQPEEASDVMEEQENKTEYFTKSPVIENKDEEESENKPEDVTVPEIEKVNPTDAPVKVKTSMSDEKYSKNYTQTSVVTEISKNEHVITTDIPEIEIITDKIEEIKSDTQKEEDKENTNQQEVSVHITKQESSSDSGLEKITQKDTKVQPVENVMPGFNIFDPASIISTSVSSEISQETEICYRGRCIKTKKQDHKKVQNVP